jgi:hypothetical protein
MLINAYRSWPLPAWRCSPARCSTSRESSMARIQAEPNVRAFLDMLALSEIGNKLLAESDDGYNVIVGGQLFHSYIDHPRVRVQVKPGLWSTAAGRYQLLGSGSTRTRRSSSSRTSAPRRRTPSPSSSSRKVQGAPADPRWRCRGRDRPLLEDLGIAARRRLRAAREQARRFLLAAYLNAGGVLA